MQNVDGNLPTAPTKAVLKPAPLKNASMNPYTPRSIDINAYTNVAGSATAKARQEQPAKPQSTFVNPYVSTRPLTAETPSLGRSTSESVLLFSPPAAPVAPVQLSTSSTRPSHSPYASARLNAAASSSRRSPPATRPDLRPSSSSSSRHKRSHQRKVNNAVVAQAPGNPNPPPGPDSTWIHKGLALKMKFTDFQPGEYIVRSDWHGSMKFPENLDPPNGLDTLRCLFCEKQYAGVNARSMWRRHVSQKHDVILAGAKTMNIAPRSRSRKSAKNHKSSRSTVRSVRDDAANRSYETIIDDSDEDDGDEDEDASEDDMIVQDDLQGATNVVEGGEGDETPVDDDGSKALVGDAATEHQEESVEPVLVANQDWDDVPASHKISYSFDGQLAAPQAPQALPTATHTPMRRTVSTPAYLPAVSPAGILSSLSSFLLPPFEEGGKTPINKGKANAASSDPVSHRTSSTTPPPPSISANEYHSFHSSAHDLATTALKKHKLALLPGITLVPALRTPRRADDFSSPPPRISRVTGMTPRWLGTPGAGPSSSRPNNDSPLPGSSSQGAHPSTPDKPRGMRHAFSSSYPMVGAETSTPAPVGRKRTMSESERTRWMMALESPGPLPFGSSPDASSRFNSFLTSSPLGPPSAHKGRSYFMPPPHAAAGSSSPMRPDELKENEGLAGASNSSFSQSHRRMRSVSMSIFDTPGSSVFSAGSHSHTRRSPRGPGGSQTRSSSVDLDSSFASSSMSLDDDPFRSMHLDSTFPFDLGMVHLQDTQPSSKLLFGGIGGSPMPSIGMKRARDDESPRKIMMLSPRNGHGNSPELEIDAFDWDRDMSPVKKRLKPSTD